MRARAPSLSFPCVSLTCYGTYGDLTTNTCSLPLSPPPLSLPVSPCLSQSLPISLPLTRGTDEEGTLSDGRGVSLKPLPMLGRKTKIEPGKVKGIDIRQEGAHEGSILAFGR